ncbi:MAG TPA: porin [Polyangiaceae bacterium]|nr:porin [Polyangiaceae bacterium]
MNISTRTCLTKLLACCAFGSVALAAQRVSADIVLLEKDGWNVATNGRVNGYLTWVAGQAAPTPNSNADGVPYTLVGPQVGLTGVTAFDSDPDARRQVSTPRLRSGYASSILGLNITKQLAPELKALGRFALWSPLSATLPAGAERTKNHEITPSMREAYLEVTGNWGSGFVGRRMSLFSRGHIQLNWNLVHDEGVGHPCNIEGTAQATCGYTGVGSMFANRNAQLGYSTPKLGGFHLTLAVVDPTPLPVAPATAMDPMPANSYNRTPLPRFEFEANYDPEFGDTKVFAFVNGMVQTLARSDNDEKRTAWGIAGGGRIHLGKIALGLGPYYGKGLGTATPFSNCSGPGCNQEAVDGAGDLRAFWGFLAGANVRIVNTELAAAYGTARARETDFDEDNNVSLIQSASGIAFKVAQHIDQVSVSADYMHVMYDWHRGESQRTNVLSVGAQFVW